MATMDALLQIKADVSGEGQVESLTRSLRGMQGVAGAIKNTFSGFGNLIPAALGAGIVGIAKSAIDAADNMRDLSQKTGISVEMLSKLDVAARQSGTNIETVGAALSRFNGRLVEAAEKGSGPTADALNRLGIAATDASGKLKSADTVLLEIADRFAKMPDGPQKSALALDLFGRAGANLIPLLNGGSAAIKDIAATMTTDFANGADALNDKIIAIQAKLTSISVSLAENLLPVLESLVNMVDSIASALSMLPEPMQQAIVTIGGLVVAIGLLAGPIINLIKLVGMIGTAFGSLQLGAIIAGWLGALGPAMAAIGSFLSAAGAAIAAFFTGPVGIAVLIAAGIALLVKAIWDYREPIMNFLNWVGTAGMNAMKYVGALAYEWHVKPWLKAWDMIKSSATSLGNWLKSGWDAIGKSFATYILSPIQKAWNSVVQASKASMNAVLRAVGSGINNAIGAINKLISAYNRLPTPDLPFVPQINVPQFGDGGYVTKPTLALVGEKGPEYIVPARKMEAATGATPVSISITTGPVLEQNGQRYVSINDLEKAMRATADGVMSQLRTPAARMALGLR